MVLDVFWSWSKSGVFGKELDKKALGGA